MVDAGKVIQEFEQIIRSNKKNILWLTYQQSIIIQTFKEKDKFAKMITVLSVCKQTFSFKIAIVGLINQYPKIKNSSLCLYFLKKHMEVMKENCKENASKFK